MNERAFYSNADMAVIRDFAAGALWQRDNALGIHRRVIDTARRSGQSLPRGNLFFDFMSEIDNPVPDLSLRARYRAALSATPGDSK